MEPCNDNCPRPEASRLLLIAGRVEPDGRVILERRPDGDDETPAWSPNDPREA